MMGDVYQNVNEFQQQEYQEDIEEENGAAVGNPRARNLVQSLQMQTRQVGEREQFNWQQ